MSPPPPARTKEGKIPREIEIFKGTLALRFIFAAFCEHKKKYFIGLISQNIGMKSFCSCFIMNGTDKVFSSFSHQILG